MPDVNFTLGQLSAQIEALGESIREFKSDTSDRFDRIDVRLEAGDKKFQAAATDRAATAAAHGLAIKVGAGILAVASGIGAWVLSHAQWIIDLFIPPKGH